MAIFITLYYNSFFNLIIEQKFQNPFVPLLIHSNQTLLAAYRGL